MTKIFIDPGHGGSDPGAVGNGLQEKDLTLKIAKKIQALLKDYEDVEVKMSRTTDKFLSLDQRTDAANSWNADFFLSVHINAGGGTGYEDYRYNTLAISSRTGKVHAAIHNAIMDELESYNVVDRGTKASDLHVLRESDMAAILTESLFIDTRKDANLLKNDDFLDAVALGHVKGLERAFNLKKKAASTTYKIKAGDTFWDIEERLNIKHGTLKNLNPNVNATELKVGQSIRIK
ncbi:MULTISPECIES: N-acetylmuramoyl-L-alanine amidase [Bacillaceae]|uniref:N-acetylmuramoyl-L-alanine amidase n=1 Tax=Bacillaceae TaxID=186817 RepID=UPI001E39321C|nr:MULTISPECIES: N-acetylmuramoyl-L-alanine amidase [Bacillaceae]MCE4047718.1 N-acetylmuramoyl-L-alanine amidase [Bacillus sp. Au-Bac7]MCM3031165.1 N-acetylmuramoyl-L-alanine amidase [Niallia sp. MER 6]MDL0434742.1 N-acetylmuramoyl-L-alanine amidase [Niallia sp. SS-2023]UPO85946.1 N-acetylmuramoyl-L-alanine amidase [Niallia sp. Man26]